MVRYLIIFFLFIVPHYSWSTEPFRHFTVEDGLPTNNIITFTQDHDGFMWVGTVRGISRFDGKRFRTYMFEPNGVNHAFIASLYTDKAGRIWEGNPQGVLLYNKALDRFEHVRYKGELLGHTYAFVEDDAGGLWIGGDKGLYYRNALGQIEKIPFHTTGKHIKALVREADGKLWMGTDGGLILLDKGNVSTFLPFPAGPIHRNWIQALHRDANGDIWVGLHGEGLAKFEVRQKKFTFYPNVVHPVVRCITPDRNGRLWIGTLGGISIMDPHSGRMASILQNPEDPYSLSSNAIYGIFMDQVGSMWVASYFGGINLREAYGTLFRVLAYGALHSKVVTGMVQVKENELWIATDGGGLHRWNKKEGTVRVLKHSDKDPNSLSSNFIKTLYKDKDGFLWIGTYKGGINVLRADEHSFSHFRPNHSTTAIDEVTCFAEDERGHLYVTANSGVTRYKKNGRVLSDSTLIDRPVTGYNLLLFKDSKKRIWVTGASSLGYYLDGKPIKVDSTHYFTCITETKDGEVWVGGEILAKFDGNKLVEYRADFLKDLDVLGILPGDQNDFWISTSKGLVHYFPTSEEYRMYTYEDGLAGTEFNYYSSFKDNQGLLYFGGLNGLTYFHPQDIKVNPIVPPLYFIQIRWKDSTLFFRSQTQSLSFSHDDNTFSIDFALLNYIKPNKNQYRYRLKNYDQDWIDTFEPTATYTNLPAGNYFFEVQGANNDGVWSEVEVLKFKVNPPFWKTWWAYTLYTLAILALISFILRYFFLKELFKREEQMSQAKLDFFTYASHEIRTQLTLISVPLEKLSQRLKADTDVSGQLEQIKHQTSRLTHLVRELLDFRKAEPQNLPLLPKRINLQPFLKEICLSFEETAKLNRIHFSYQLTSVEAVVDPRQLEKVFFNLISNAIKFTPAGGKVVVDMMLKQEAVEIRVKDSGRGIPEKDLSNVFAPFFQVGNHGNGHGIGLVLSKQIVEAHQGELVLESEEEKGTNAKVALPCFALTEILGPVEEKSSKNKIHLLVVEDHSELRDLVTEALKDQYRVTACSNGREALDLAVEVVPDLIISDVMMPIMDGFQLCQALKEDERTDHIPVILLTAKSTTAEQVEGLGHGADLYLTKPFSQHVLQLSVRNMLSQKEKLRQKLNRDLAFLTLGGENKTAEVADTSFLHKLADEIRANLDDPHFNVDVLARKVGMSTPVLYKKVKA